MSYIWLKILGADADLPEGNAPLAKLDMETRELRFEDDVTLKAKDSKFITFGAGIKTGVKAVERTFREVGAGVYTGSVVVPAGAILLDVVVHNVALWDARRAAVMIVGDVADPNGFFDAIDLKKTDLLAGEGISFAFPGGLEGADLVSTLTEGTPNTTASMHMNRRYLATERTITGQVTSVGPGTAGRTRMTVVYVLPETAAATFV